MAENQWVSFEFISPPSNWSYGTSTAQVSWPRDRSMQRRFPGVDDTGKNPVEMMMMMMTPTEKFIVIVVFPWKGTNFRRNFHLPNHQFSGNILVCTGGLKVPTFQLGRLILGGWDHPRTRIQVVDNNGCLASPQVLGLWDPFQMAFFWLINGGDPNHGCSTNTGKFPLCSSAFTDKSSWWWALKSCDINMSLQPRNPLEVPRNPSWKEMVVTRNWDETHIYLFSVLLMEKNNKTLHQTRHFWT